jgi:hypothetical protein
MANVDASSPYWMIAIALVLLGIGMGVTVAPATGSIMAAVPLNKAGIGSAVNDTTREVGGALGIAVLGSIANSVYRSGIDTDTLAALPPEVADTAGESVGAALAVAGRLPGATGAELASAARDAFTTAFNTALGSSAAVAAIIGLIVFGLGRRFRERARDLHASAPAVTVER